MKAKKILGTDNSPYVQISEEENMVVLKILGRWYLNQEIKKIISKFFKECKRMKEKNIAIYFYIDKYNNVDYGYMFDLFYILHEIGENNTVTVFWYRNTGYFDFEWQKEESRNRMNNFEKTFSHIEFKIRKCSFEKFYKDDKKFPATKAEVIEQKELRLIEPSREDDHNIWCNSIDKKQWRFLIAAEKNEPAILISYDESVMEIRGRGNGPNAMGFFEPVYEEIYRLTKLGKIKKMITKIEYFETAYSKILLDILKIFCEKTPQGIVEWYYEKEDEDALELGEDFGNCLHRKFKFIEIESFR